MGVSKYKVMDLKEFLEKYTFYSLMGVSSVMNIADKISFEQLSTPLWEFLGILSSLSSVCNKVTFYSLMGVSLSTGLLLCTLHILAFVFLLPYGSFMLEYDLIHPEFTDVTFYSLMGVSAS